MSSSKGQYPDHMLWLQFFHVALLKKITWFQYANHTIISLLLYFFLRELNSYHRNKKNQTIFKNVYKIVYIICRCFFFINYGTNLNYVMKYSFLIEYVIPGKKPNIFFYLNVLVSATIKSKLFVVHPFVTTSKLNTWSIWKIKFENLKLQLGLGPLKYFNVWKLFN